MTVTRRKLRPGETIFGGGSGILIPIAKPSSDSYKPPYDPRPTMTEEQIQAELKKLRDEGRPPENVAFFESLMRGLEGKPQGNA